MPNPYARAFVVLAAALLFASGGLSLLPSGVPSPLAPAPARADGDPASDTLLGANVFYPYETTVSPSLKRTLDAQTATLAQRHFPLKVALIHAPFDLGAIPSLFNQPQRYASFLDQEISFFGHKQPLLVVMPDGYGTAGVPSPAAAALRGFAPPAAATTDALASAAIRAVTRVASSAGHPLPASLTGSSGGGSGSSPLIAGVLAAVAVLAAAVILVFRQRRASRP